MDAGLGQLARDLLTVLDGLAGALPDAVDGFEATPSVSRSQLAALRYLAEHGPVEMQRLAAGVGVSSPTMTATVRLLREKGLVTRTHDEVDMRRVFVAATDVGSQAQAAFATGRAERLAAAMGRLGAEQRALLLVALPALRATVAELSLVEGG